MGPSGRGEKRYKNIKCSLKSVIAKKNNPDKNESPRNLDLNEELLRAIENRCVAVSRMAARASVFCQLMVEKLLRKEEKKIYDNNNRDSFPSGNETTIEWPDFEKLNVFCQLFTKGINLQKLRKPTPAIEKTWEKHQNILDQCTKNIGRFHSDCNLIRYCAKTFQTAFQNNLRLNFVFRQRRAIREALYLRDQSYCPSLKGKKRYSNTLIYALQCLINGWEYKGKTYNRLELDRLECQHREWIEKHRRRLPTNSQISEKKLSLVELIRYYHFLKTEYGEANTKLKNIKLVPKNDIKVHYADFDTAGVKGLCHDLGFKVETFNKKNLAEKRSVDGKEKAREERGEEKESLAFFKHHQLLEAEGWNKIFDISKIKKMGGKSSTWIFDRCIATDGVACSIRYYKWVERKKREKNKKKYEKVFNPTSSTANNRRCFANQRIIGIDPGRKNVAFCVELHPESRKIVKKTKLTSKQYYCDSGFTRHKKKIQKWLVKDEKYKKANEELSQCKTTLEYTQKLNQHGDILWETKTTKKWRRSKFRVYCLKKKTLDNFVNEVIGDRSDPFHIAFGAAKFAPTGKGEHYASPCSALGKLIRERVGESNFSLVNEWNTSKLCHRCSQPLTRVAISKKKDAKPKKGDITGERNKEEEEEKDEIGESSADEKKKTRKYADYRNDVAYLRGLLRCCSSQSANESKNVVESKLSIHNDNGNNLKNNKTYCPIGGSFVDRDSNAATNIATRLLQLTATSPSPSLSRVKVTQRKTSVFFI